MSDSVLSRRGRFGPNDRRDKQDDREDEVHPGHLESRPRPNRNGRLFQYSRFRSTSGWVSRSWRDCCIRNTLFTGIPRRCWPAPWSSAPPRPDRNRNRPGPRPAVGRAGLGAVRPRSPGRSVVGPGPDGANTARPRPSRSNGSSSFHTPNCQALPAGFTPNLPQSLAWPFGIR